MKVALWAFGAPSDDWVITGENIFVKRISHYLPFEFKCFQPVKAKNRDQVLAGEAKWMLQQLDNTPTWLVLLDEHGKEYTSVDFSKKIEAWRQGTHKRIIFLIGSAYGFDAAIRDRANETMRISKMTLPHQLCRLLTLEQIYRACTIQRNESYHHE